MQSSPYLILFSRPSLLDGPIRDGGRIVTLPDDLSYLQPIDDLSRANNVCYEFHQYLMFALTRHGVVQVRNSSISIRLSSRIA